MLPLTSSSSRHQIMTPSKMNQNVFGSILKLVNSVENSSRDRVRPAENFTRRAKALETPLPEIFAFTSDIELRAPWRSGGGRRQDDFIQAVVLIGIQLFEFAGGSSRKGRPILCTPWPQSTVFLPSTSRDGPNIHKRFFPRSQPMPMWAFL